MVHNANLRNKCRGPVCSTSTTAGQLYLNAELCTQYKRNEKHKVKLKKKIKTCSVISLPLTNPFGLSLSVCLSLLFYSGTTSHIPCKKRLTWLGSMEQMVMSDALSAAQMLSLILVCTDKDEDRLGQGRGNYILSWLSWGVQHIIRLQISYYNSFWRTVLANVAAGQGVYPAKLASTVSGVNPQVCISLPELKAKKDCC